MASLDGPSATWDPKFTRTQLLGATVALALSVSALRIFRANEWPGEYVVQWAIFYTVMWLTVILNAPRAHRWRVLWRFLPVCILAAALTAWVAISAARP